MQMVTVPERVSAHRHDLGRESAEGLGGGHSTAEPAPSAPRWWHLRGREACGLKNNPQGKEPMGCGGESRHTCSAQRYQRHQSWPDAVL